jgi:photosystem II stability/assembly factor-like uncharacterized protein
MKKYFIPFILILSLSFTIYAQVSDTDTEWFRNLESGNSRYSVLDPQPIHNSGWEWLHPTPQGNAQRYLKVWDANNWYILGYSGTFLKTTNAGATWFLNKNIAGLAASGFSYNLFGGHFFDMNTGLACGENGVLVRTSDAGLTWSSVYSGTTGFIYDLFFLNNNVGFACGLTTVGLLKTTDAGLTWTQAATIPANAYCLYAFDENNILLGSANGNVLRTTNGGTTWTTVYAAGISLIWGIDFSNATTGMVSGIDAALAYTTDAGASWTIANTGIPPTSDFLDIDYRQNAFYATGDPYDMYYTTNLGTTWNTIDYTDPNQSWTSSFTNTDFINDNEFVTIGNSGMINKTTITPNSAVASNFWIKANTLFDNYADSASGRVIAVGVPGISGVTFDQAMYSTDRGNTWSIAALVDSTEHDFNSLSMVTPLIGYAACEDHFVYKTTNGGESWFQVTQPAVSTADLETIYFVDANTGYTFGATGLGYKTTDGGTTWSTLTTGVTVTLNGSYFLNASTGYICGSTGNLLKTTDGGATFTPLTPNNTGTLYAIYMVNENVGYLAGATGRVRKTTDGGTTWSTVDVGLSVTLYDIKFRDEMNGIVAAANSSVFITTDGGTTWDRENTGAGTNYSVYIENSNVPLAAVYIVGSPASIMRKFNAIVPVELASFTASVSGTSVMLNWQTITEQNNSGFSIERKSTSEEWRVLGFIEGYGTTTEIRNYTFADNNLAAGIYNYRLKQQDYNGSYKYYNLTSEVEIGTPENFSLSQNYPNPFNPETKINFALASAANVNLKVFDILGQEVALLVNSYLEPGMHSVKFDASSLNSGVYFYTIEAIGIDGKEFVSVKKMTLLK